MSPGAGQVPLSIVNDLDQPVTNEVPEVTFTWTGDSSQLVRSQSSQMLMSPLASARSRSGDSGISRILRCMSSDSGDGGDLRCDHSIPRLRSLSDDFDQHVYQRQVMYLQQEDLQVKKDSKQYEKSALRLSSSTTGSGMISPRLPHEDTFDHLSLGEPFLKDIGVANYFSGYSGNKKRMVENSSGLNVHFEPFSVSSHSLDPDHHPDHHPIAPPLPLESANVDERIEKWLQQLDPHISCDEAILPTASKDEMIEGHQESITQLIHMITQDEELLADIDSLDSNGYNLLHYCCIYNLYKLLEVLLAKKADPNRLSNTAHGMSSGLHLAVKGNASVQLVQMLTQHNAILNLHDSQNRTPYDLAVAYKRTALIEYFKNHINFTQHNHTPLASRSPPLPPIPPFYTGTGTSAAPTLQRATSDDDKMISTQVFHEVFQNLTITEKCALALSMSPRISDSPKHHGVSPNGKNNSKNNNKNNSHQRQSSSTFSFISAPSPLVDDSISSPFDSQSRIIGASGNRLSSSGSPVKNILRNSDFYQYSVINEEGHNYDHPYANNDDDDGDDASTITDVDLKSVISRRDLDHLQSAMQLMGETELKEVESEVRNIQKNVRGWLLRKNYNSLRASALTLQSAWRERKRHQQGLKSSSNEMSASLSGPLNPGSGSLAHTPTLEDTLSYEYNDMQELADALLAEDSTMNIDDGGGQPSGVPAHNYYLDPSALSPQHQPNTLGSYSNDALTASTTDNNNHYPSTDTASVSQSAATRGMTSRTAFASVRQQAIASLVIQKSLRSWWGKQRQTGDQTAQPHSSSAPPSSTAYIGGSSGKSLGGQELERQDSGTTISQSRSNKRPYDKR